MNSETRYHWQEILKAAQNDDADYVYELLSIDGMTSTAINFTATLYRSGVNKITYYPLTNKIKVVK